jgi:hypothetical protein
MIMYHIIVAREFKFNIICLGEEAYNAMKQLRSTLDSKFKSMCSIRSYRYLHPSYIYRNYKGDAKAISTNTLTQCIDTANMLFVLFNIKPWTIPDTIPRFQYYNTKLMHLMGDNKRLFKVLNNVVELKFESMRTRFYNEVYQRLNKNIYSDTLMRSYKSNMGNDTRAIMAENYFNTSTNVLTRLGNTATELQQKNADIVKRLSSVINLIDDQMDGQDDNGDTIVFDAEEMKALAEVASNLVENLARINSFFHSIPSLCISKEGAVNITGSTLSPLINVTKEETQETVIEPFQPLTDDDIISSPPANSSRMINVETYINANNTPSVTSEQYNDNTTTKDVDSHNIYYDETSFSMFNRPENSIMSDNLGLKSMNNKTDVATNEKLSKPKSRFSIIAPMSRPSSPTMSETSNTSRFSIPETHSISIPSTVVKTSNTRKSRFSIGSPANPTTHE